jgi:REP-associated tyrosine transposase
MPRLARSSLPDFGVFHVYSRGVNGTVIAHDDRDRIFWVSTLEDAIRRFDLTCHAYCLMPNHFHLVLEGALEHVSSGMHRLNGLYAQTFNRRHARTGHLFQGRFGIRVIEDESYLHDTCEYVLRNPVRAGLCQAPRDWPWAARVA